MLKSKIVITSLSFLFLFNLLGCSTTGPGIIPLNDLSQGQSGKIYYEVPKDIDLTDILTGKINDSKKELIYGKFLLPEFVEGKIPAVVIMHGSSGVNDWRELKIAKELNKNGIAAFIPYSFASRGIINVKNTKGTGITFGMRLADAYNALTLLSTHPRICAERIGMLGYSSGGIVSIVSADKKISKVMSEPNLVFASHVNVYTCPFLIFENSTPTDAPVLFLIGEKDDLCEKDNVLNYVESLKEKGAQVETIIYPGAYHLFDANFSLRRIDMDNDGACQYKIQEDGKLISTEKGEKFSEREWVNHTKPCSKQGVTFGRNASAADNYIKDAVNFFKKSLYPEYL